MTFVGKRSFKNSYEYTAGEADINKEIFLDEDDSRGYGSSEIENF